MKGVSVRRTALLLVLGLLLAACGSSRATAPTPAATHVAQAQPSPTATSAAGTPASVHPTATSRPVSSKPRPAASSSYISLLSTTCHAFAAADANTVSNELPYYQYNSGLRYGILGDGEGQTGDPSLLGTWLQGGAVRCEYYTPDTSGHGTALASGFKQPGGWGLIEFDTFNGVWKINDFTFGDRASLYRAMQTSQPVLVYHGH